MKRVINFAIVGILSLTLVLIAGIGTVSAQTIPPATGEGNATWVWIDPLVPASIIPMPQVVPAPPTWQQLLSTGLAITGPARICYPFRGAQFGWVGQIRLLFEGTWIPITTTVQWDPTGEGKIMACATVRYAGTYALFGYWQPIQYWTPVPVK